MRVYDNIQELPCFKNAIVTIGTFDGVHVGHQRIIQKINNIAANKEGESVLITFHPHPRTVINADIRVPLLTPISEKMLLLEKYAVDNMVIVPFNRSFSEQSPHEYIRSFIVENFHPSVIVIGYNHRFGNNRAGDIHLLKSLEDELRFKVEEISETEIKDISISSTKIRAAIQDGNVEIANALLGHAYSLTGVVIKGQQLGQKIGFPTANIQIANQDKLIPKHGVYAVRVKYANQIFQGMLNIGNRPTVQSVGRHIETHIFDFEGDLYGESLIIELEAFVREEQKFEDIHTLKNQINKDKIAIEAILNK